MAVVGGVVAVVVVFLFLVICVLLTPYCVSLLKCPMVSSVILLFPFPGHMTGVGQGSNLGFRPWSTPSMRTGKIRLVPKMKYWLKY